MIFEYHKEEKEVIEYLLGIINICLWGDLVVWFFFN